MAKRSKLEQFRAERKNQSPERRSEIVDAAEAVFLERGLAGTTMSDIAERVGVSRVTAYRYFSDRDHVAFEVAARMLEELSAAVRPAVPPDATPIGRVRAGLLALVTEFDSTRDAHRYLAMFDNARPFRSPTEQLDRWYLERSHEAFTFGGDQTPMQEFDADTAARILTLTNSLMDALARYATNGQALTQEQGVTQDAQLTHLKELVLSYFDTVIAPQAKPAQHSPR